MSLIACAGPPQEIGRNIRKSQKQARRIFGNLKILGDVFKIAWKGEVFPPFGALRLGWIGLLAEVSVILLPFLENPTEFC
jgi:hypothetical protein